MNIMSIFQTNWLDFLTWTLAGCMVIALIVYLLERWAPSTMIERTKKVVNWPRQFRKAS